MFDQITKRLSTLTSRLTSTNRLTASHIEGALTEIRNALIEADVAVDIVKPFINELRDKVNNLKIEHSKITGQLLIDLVRTELLGWMGASEPINLRTKPPAIILLVGLQGAGKTTTAGKLAKYLSDYKKKKVAMVSCDIYRPAAINQLKIICQQVGCMHLPTDDNAIITARQAVQRADETYCDVLIVDTAGRLHVDQEMMEEARLIQQAIDPIETLFVLDSMSGQDALHSARAFATELALTGIMMTKVDGESRGGSALSARAVVGKPIKFIGVGEKLDALQVFHPDRIVSRILGMGEMKTLLETYDRVVGKKKSEKLTHKIKKGGFDLNDLRDQLNQINQMGGLNSLVDKLPAVMTDKVSTLKADTGEKQMKKMLAVISSMTESEKMHPNSINGSRKKRIARGSGTQIQDINRVLKQYEQMKKMLSKSGKLKKMASLATSGFRN